MFEGLANSEPLVIIAFIIGFTGLVAILFVVVKIVVGTKKYHSTFKDSDYFAEYSEFPARKPIPDDLIFTPDVSTLPIKDYNDNNIDPSLRKPVSVRQNEAIKRANTKMLHFNKPKTNNELKTEFGYANLELIASYEVNFERYSHAMLRWAQALFDEGEAENAAMVLESSINYGSELSKAYILLATIYAQTQSENENKQEQLTKLQNIYNIVSERHMPAKDKTLEQINIMMKNIAG